MNIDLRDYFAGQAMQAMLAKDNAIDMAVLARKRGREVTETAYGFADAMLKARNAGQPRTCTEQGCCYQGKPRVDSCECYKEK